MQSNEGLFSAIPADLLAGLPVYSVKGAANVVAPPPKAPPKPAPAPMPNTWERFFEPVNDPRLDGSEVVHVVAEFLFSKQRNTMFAFLEKGGRFPVHHAHIPGAIESIKQWANDFHGQKFALSFCVED